jgi:DNA-binding transcriptional regulator YiaG
MKKSISDILQKGIIDLQRHNRADAEASLGEQLKALRRERKLTQQEFANLYDLPLGNVRNWEQASRGTLPDATGRLLLKMILANPDGVADLVRRTRRAATGS